MPLPSLWLDNISEDTLLDWIEGSTCNKLVKDINILKKYYESLPNTKKEDYSKCKGCQFAPFNAHYMRCKTCIKHTKYEASKKIPKIIKWLRVDTNTVWDTEDEAKGTKGLIPPYNVIKLTE